MPKLLIGIITPTEVVLVQSGIHLALPPIGQIRLEGQVAQVLEAQG